VSARRHDAQHQLARRSCARRRRRAANIAARRLAATLAPSFLEPDPLDPDEYREPAAGAGEPEASGAAGAAAGGDAASYAAGPSGRGEGPHLNPAAAAEAASTLLAEAAGQASRTVWARALTLAVRAYVRMRRATRAARARARDAAGSLVPEAARAEWAQASAELPPGTGFWDRLHWVWERPMMKSVRITVSVANWGVRLPAIMALVLTQGGIIASQVSLPMLAPLLLGTGMLCGRSPPTRPSSSPASACWSCCCG